MQSLSQTIWLEDHLGVPIDDATLFASSAGTTGLEYGNLGDGTYYIIATAADDQLSWTVEWYFTKPGYTFDPAISEYRSNAFPGTNPDNPQTVIGTPDEEEPVVVSPRKPASIGLRLSSLCLLL